MPAVLALLGLAACSDRGEKPTPAAAAKPAAPAPQLAYVSQPIGNPMEGRPWISHVDVVDLDGDGLPDVLVCDAQSN